MEFNQHYRPQEARESVLGALEPNTSEGAFANIAPEEIPLTPAPSVFDLSPEPINPTESATPFTESGEPTTVSLPPALGVRVPWRRPDMPFFAPEPQELVAGITDTASLISDPAARKVYEEYAQKHLAATTKDSAADTEKPAARYDT